MSGGGHFVKYRFFNKISPLPLREVFWGFRPKNKHPSMLEKGGLILLKKLYLTNDPSHFCQNSTLLIIMDNQWTKIFLKDVNNTHR